MKMDEALHARNGARPVGIIANPASGKDIRRLVAHASIVDNNEKARIVRRMLLALDAAGIEHVLALPDYAGIVRRAADGVPLRLRIDETPIPRTAREDDTTAAAAAMEAVGVAAIIVLGGDGTGRATALGARHTPLIAISTGTNNVFPEAIDGSVAGLAAAALALGLVQAGEVAVPAKVLHVTGPMGATLALIDIAVLAAGPVAARALWKTEELRAAFLTRASAALQGLAGVAGLLRTVTAADPFGLELRFGAGTRLRAPLAPGLYLPLEVASMAVLQPGESREVVGPCLLALDGERAIEIPAGMRAVVSLCRDGPPVVNVRRAVELAASRGLLRG